MASKRNVIKATKSPMGPATCYTTNMTRCVIRPTYKGGSSYLPCLQGESSSLTETARERERKRGGERGEKRDLRGLTFVEAPRRLDSLYMKRGMMKKGEPENCSHIYTIHKVA